MKEKIRIRENKLVDFSSAEIDTLLFKLYMLESKISNWNNDKRELRVSNRRDAYDLLSGIISILQNKL